MKYLSLLPLSLSLMLACSPTSPKREPPPITHDGVEVDALTVTAEVNSKVDILFVVDNSESMLDDQQNMARNIDGFLKAFADQTLIDFHVGVTTIYDTKRLAPQGVPNGVLVPVKAKDGKVVAGPRFITRDTPDFLESLKNTITVGVWNFKDGGPEHEESFSPVVSALTEPALSKENAAFYRPEAYLMVIFLTDTDDQSQISTEEFQNFLMTLKGNKKDKVLTVGALFPSRTYDKNPAFRDRQPDTKGDLLPEDQTTCQIGDHVNKRDPDGAPYRLVDFLYSMEGKRLSLCDIGFGPRMAKIGIDLSAKIAEQVIYLDGIPDDTRNPTTGLPLLKVYYGDKELCGNDPVVDAKKAECDGGKIHWKYDDTNYAVIIPSEMKLERQPGAKFSVKMIGLKPNSHYTRRR